LAYSPLECMFSQVHRAKDLHVTYHCQLSLRRLTGVFRDNKRTFKHNLIHFNTKIFHTDKDLQTSQIVKMHEQSVILSAMKMIFKKFKNFCMQCIRRGMGCFQDNQDFVFISLTGTIIELSNIFYKNPNMFSFAYNILNAFKEPELN